MKNKFFLRFLLTLAVAGPLIRLRAEVEGVGDDNPTGVSGQFNGNVTTGGSYDPYTGNAFRPITDLVVPGAVGAYPLAFTRTLNTRQWTYSLPGAGFAEFGKSGGWRHSYQWSVGRSIITTSNEAARPTIYNLFYPDGRLVQFSHQAGSDPYFRSNTAGVTERFQPMDPNGQSTGCYLLLPDGGRVQFQANITTTYNNEGIQTSLIFDYSLVAIIDPHGQTTLISGTFDNGHDNFRVNKIVEPAGRQLIITYATGGPIQSVTELTSEGAANGRTVTYNYVSFTSVNQSYTTLDHVDYFGDASLTATYAYQDSNYYPGFRAPVVTKCNDSMFAGSMSKIAYAYVPGGAQGQISAEKNYDGIPVSTLVTNGNTRTEIRGDGPSRTFTYTGGYLTSWTDFNGNSPSQQFHAGFVTHATDANGKTTDFVRDALTGKATLVTYPLTTSDTSSPGTTAIAYNSGNDPYFLASVTDERSKTTAYVRPDSNTQLVSDINYPDTAHEGFQYNSFDQISRHQRKNGYYEHFEYDTRGRLIHSWNPVASATRPTGNEAKTTFTYYSIGDAWQDRVQSVTDPLGKTTTYAYEANAGGTHLKGRGLVSKITFADGKNRSFVYDRNGRKTSEVNELGQAVNYEYDEYGRLKLRKTPHPSASDPAVADGWDVLSYDYTPPAGGALALTAPAATTITTPAGVVTQNVFDANLRLSTNTRLNPGGQNALTQFHYDPAGNQDWVIDPNGKKTTMTYDARNRRSTVTTPPVDVSGTTGKVPLVTQWYYDPAGNVRRIIQSDAQEQLFTHDELHRVLTETDPMSRVTTYTYFSSGMLKTVEDPKHNVTSFTYNERDLKKNMTYPVNQGVSTTVGDWGYDADGNLTERPTVGGPKQLFTYDNRNRLTAMRWNNGIDFSDFTYDFVGRLKSAINPYSAITREYDVAGRMTLDRQLLAASFNTAATAVVPQSVVSRQTHGSQGSFNIPLPFATGSTPGIECRSTGGNYTLVFTFANPVTAGGATVNFGIGTVINFSGSGTTEITVNLTGVSDAQRMTVKLFGLSDGANTGEVTVPMQVLIGDANGSGSVSAADVNQTRSYSGVVTGSANFRCDVNVSGSISAADITLVSSRSGDLLPIPPSTAPQVDVSYAYDADGRVTRLSGPSTSYYNFAYAYDGMGRMEKIHYTPNGEVPVPANLSYQYYYDPASNVLQRMNWLKNTAQFFTPDEINRMKQCRLSAIYHDGAGAAHAYDFSIENYGYDRMSRAVTTDRTLTAPGTNPAQEVTRDVFGYNYAGELSSAQYDMPPNGQGGFGAPVRTVGYGLDDGGNRTSVNDSVNGNVGYSVNNLNQYDQTSSGSQHEITSYPIGNLAVTYGYLADTYLATVSSASGGTYKLGYDALGRCVKRTTNDAAPLYFAYDGVRAIIAYCVDAGTVYGNNIYATTFYGLGVDEIIARGNNGVGQFPLQNRLGSTTAITGGTGEVTEQYRYDVFGTPEFRGPPVAGNPRGTLSTTGTMVNNQFLFAGREWAPNFGFYENRARAYHPTLGRFMSEDPMGFAGGDTNLFRYCSGDPVNYFDPNGLRTAQIGLAFTGQIGPFAFSLGFGVAVDGHSNIAVYGSLFRGGAAPGVDAALVWGAQYSNADHIYQLEGPFYEGSVTGGDAVAASVVGFRNLDGTVKGGGIFTGAGAGAGLAFGTSSTALTPGWNIFDWNLTKPPSPGGSTDVGPCGPGCAVAERVVVQSTFLDTYGSWSTVAGFGGGGSYDFAPGGGGRISQAIEAALGGGPELNLGFGGPINTYIDGGRSAGGSGGIGRSPGWLIR